MSEEKLLTVREVASLLGVSEKEVLDLAENASIPAYKLGGVYLRFKKNQVEEYKRNAPRQRHSLEDKERLYLKDRISDFLYFNDFYILAGLCMILLAIFVYRGL